VNATPIGKKIVGAKVHLNELPMRDIGVTEVLAGAGLALLMLVLSLVVIGIALLRVSPGHFLEERSGPASPTSHSAWWWLGRILKNVLGYALIALGLAMSVPLVPGQGFLTIFIGLTLIDFPGKRRIERKIIGRPRILRTVNRFRCRFGRMPLALG
jgi:hypothetical protein